MSFVNAPGLSFPRCKLIVEQVEVLSMSIFFWTLLNLMNIYNKMGVPFPHCNTDIEVV
jgi:hypothetical protein